MMVSNAIATKLEGLQGEEWNSDSDNEQGAKATTTLEMKEDVIPLPLSKNNRKARLAAEKGGAQSGSSKVVYLGRIPHGFYEEQMYGFFKQFGNVTRLRLSRNKRTGKSKHFAFIEFQDAEVAKIVADTMNDYYLFDHKLSCQLVPTESIHERLFIGANRAFKVHNHAVQSRKEHNAERTYSQERKRCKRILRKEMQKRHILETLGIDYQYSGHADQIAVKDNVHVHFHKV
uniref:FHA domaininteracting nucleolar phosphoprotein putat n=1 Tax=Albugo laibachii Nc14 TaxID=890382 RepID=F0WJJ2_9STRA|nr:FHA domaininteracting nucleolar phosphoprotein putat [Albugo laibachii Nc14]|eukprot:CCA21441.1 FHA domaininteracting nucleolar phosphoprotein putat [Albugo laibachii Nc14]